MLPQGPEAATQGSDRPSDLRVALTGASGFIGSHVAEAFLARGAAVLNLDVRPATLPILQDRTRLVDVRQPVPVGEALGAFAPTHVVHLAARTDMSTDPVQGYAVNYEGTRVVAEASRALGVRHLVHVSSQYVHAVESAPEGDEDFSPFTAYGESKVRSERIVREVLGGTATSWTILRPTNIWGPRHPRYATEFWRVLSRGLYVHPVRRPPAVRAYGYVGNVAWQIGRVVELGPEQLHGRVLYVGDRLRRLDDWVDAFSLLLTGRCARRVPAAMLRLVARVGDAAAAAGLPAPLTTTRLGNMTSSDGAPMEPTMRLLGDPPVGLLDGVRATGRWLEMLGFRTHPEALDRFTPAG